MIGIQEYAWLHQNLLIGTHKGYATGKEEEEEDKNPIISFVIGRGCPASFYFYIIVP